MKNNLEADGASPVPYENIPLIQAESPPAEMAADSSNNLGERIMKLPIELRQKIFFLFSPKDRRHLRLVNKAMLDAVDTSMSDVQEIMISYYWEGHCYIIIKTIDPENGDKKTYNQGAVSSSLPFLLKWAGAQLKTLKLNIFDLKYRNDDSHMSALYRVLEAINSENTCSTLKHLSLIGQSSWDNDEIILSELLQYITKRQLQAKATDHPTPFLHSLSFIYTPDYRSNGYEILNFRSKKMRKLLQDLLDQCHGLKELDVDSLLVHMDLSIVTLRYPTTLTHLSSKRLGTNPGDLPTLIDNCPNLQVVNLKIGFPRDDANFRALPWLSDLRELTFESSSVGEEIVRMTVQCLEAFEDYPFGASMARPWSQLESVTLNCYKDEKYEFPTFRLLLSGANCCITALHITRFSCSYDNPYARSVEHLFKALINEDACPNLMELKIRSCELVDCVASSLEATNHRQRCLLDLSSADLDQLSKFAWKRQRIPSPYFYGTFNDLLAYVIKRQSAVPLGRPFLRSLSIGKCVNRCRTFDNSYNGEEKHRSQLVQIRTTVQQILDQCHGLEDLYVESLNDERINPDKKKGRELMKLVPLRFPTTLKKLNGVWMD